MPRDLPLPISCIGIPGLKEFRPGFLYKQFPGTRVPGYPGTPGTPGTRGASGWIELEVPAVDGHAESEFNGHWPRDPSTERQVNLNVLALPGVPGYRCMHYFGGGWNRPQTSVFGRTIDFWRKTDLAKP
eukprot:262236-Rhodomonas_salina.1